MNILDYDTERYDFKSIVQKWFDVDNLSTIHKTNSYELFERKTDQSTIWHTLFYKKIRQDCSFNDTYINFLKNVIRPTYGGDSIVYQKIPTFRVHLPKNISVGEFHKDKNYRDVVWANKVNEMNYYLPLTTAYNTNTIWAESKEDLGDYSPFNCEYGQCIEWNGSNLTHGNKVNLEENTRVSFDFRIISRKNYIASNDSSINMETKFSIGNYYEELEVN